MLPSKYACSQKEKGDIFFSLRVAPPDTETPKAICPLNIFKVGGIKCLKGLEPVY